MEVVEPPSKWSRRKLTLHSKALYRLCFRVVACLVHALIHVHNFIWHRIRQQGLPAMSAPVSNFAFKKRTELQKVLFLTVSSPVCFTPSEKKELTFSSSPAMHGLVLTGHLRELKQLTVCSPC